MRGILVIAMACVFSTVSFAQDKKMMKEEASLFYYAPPAAMHSIDFRPGLLINTMKLEVKSNGVKQGDAETTTNIHTVTYKYSVADNMTFGAMMGIGSYKTKTTPTGGSSSETKNSGMSDLTFMYQAFNKMNDSKLRWEVDLGMSPGKAKASSTSTDGNLYTGGMSLAPSVAFEQNLSSMTWGIGATYSLLMERTAEPASGTTETKYTGGNTLSFGPYLEMPFTGGRAGAFLKLSNMGEIKSKTGTSAETTSQKSTAMTSLGGAASYNFTERFAGLAELAYSTVTNDDASGNMTSLNIGARANF